MRTIARRLACLALGIGLFALPELGRAQAKDRVILVDPREGTTVITTATLLDAGFPNGGTITTHSGALRGTLTRNAVSGDFSFAPNPDFWTLGTDRYTYTVQDNATSQTSVGLVLLMGATAAYNKHTLDFNGSVTPWALEEFQGTATVARSKLTILGALTGLQLAEANLHRVGLIGNVHGLTQGGKVVGGGGSPPPQPPPPPPSGLAEPDPDYYDSFTLLRGAEGNGGQPFHVDLRPTPQGDQVRIVTGTSGSEVQGDWYWIGLGPHRYEISWWEGSGPKVMLWADGRLVAMQDAPNLNVDRFEIGVLSPHIVTTPGLEIDDVSLSGWSNTGLDPHGKVRMIETLEDGGSSLALTGAVHVSHLNVLNGAHDLVFDAVNGQTASASYTNAGLEPDGSWNSRFRLRVDNLTIPDGAIVTVADTFSDAQGGAPFHLELRKNGGDTHQLRMVVKQNGGPDIVGPWGHVPTTGANIEVQWVTSLSPSFATGVARLWVNTVQRAELTNIDNHGLTVTGARVGLIDPDPGIVGFARLDLIQIWTLD